jgi:predicted transcriptional regulator
MRRPPQITDAEWDVMEVVWKSAPVTAQDVVEHFTENRSWTLSTVRTLLRRLEEKGAVAFRPDGKRYLYVPRVGRDECVNAEVESFSQRLFGGSLVPLIAHLVKSRGLTARDVEEIRNTLPKQD